MNPLTDIIPAAARKYVYLIAAAALFVYGIWQASAGDIRAFVIALVSALVSGLAASNVAKPTASLPQDEAGAADVGLGRRRSLSGARSSGTSTEAATTRSRSPSSPASTLPRSSSDGPASTCG